MQKKNIVFLFFLISITLSNAQNTLDAAEPHILYSKGLALIEKHNYAAARETFEDYVAKAENDLRKADAEYYIAFAALSLYHKDGEKLIEKFIKEHDQHPKAALAYYELGDFYFREKDYSKATKYLAKVRFSLLDKKQRDEARFKLGYAYFAQRHFDDALTFFNTLKRSSGPYQAASSYYAGYIEHEKKLFDEAIEDLQRAEQDPAYQRIVPGMLADIYYRQERYDVLLDYSNKILNSGVRVNQRDFYLLAAEALVRNENYKEALRYYEEYIKSIKNPPREIDYRVGYAYFKAGDLSNAITYLKQAASAEGDIGAYASYYLGIAYLKQGNKLYALTAFENTKRTTTDDVIREESAYQYLKISYDLGKMQESIEAARVFLEKYPKSSHREEVGDLLSSAYLSSNNYNLAISYIEDLKALNQRQKKVYQKATFLKGMELFNTGNYRQSLVFFRKSLQYPIDKEYQAMANLWSGEAYSVANRFEDAIPYYIQAIETGLSPRDEITLKAHYGLGYAYYNTKQYQQAMKQFSAYIDHQTSGEGYYYDALIRLADCHYVSKNYDRALSYYNRVLQSDGPDNDYAHLQAGIIQGINDNLDKAVEALNVVINNYSGSRYLDDALFQKAQLNFESGNYKEAVTNFTELISKKPNSGFVPYGYMRRASSYYNLKQYDEAIEDYLIVLNRFTSHPVAGEALLPLQEVLNLQERSDEFDKYLAMYKKANPDEKGLEQVEFDAAKNQYFNLNYEKAIAAFKDFINSYPQSAKIPEAQYYLGESHYRLGQHDQALDYYNKLVAGGAYQPMSKVLRRIGELEFKSNRFENATYFYYQLEQTARTKKEQYYAWSGLMESYFKMEQYDSAAHYAQVILEKGNVNISSQNKSSLYLGKVAYQQGEYDRAIDEFLNTLNTAKDEYGAEAKYLIGKIFYERGEYKKSIETLIELTNNFNIYKEWVGKAFLLLADNYIARKDYFQARGTLQSVIDNFPLEGVKKQAEEKLQQVNVLEKNQQNIKSDTSVFDN
ncbi:MAG: tetratricopeptide repeat protein [Fulvivirga sp.]|nr:tetratricopeptide repeat protein [Fulvivirga sp.]